MSAGLRYRDRPHAQNDPKEIAHGSEQDRPDILKRRRAWFDAQPDLDPERLVFIDETWAKINMARSHGRSPRGERLRMGFPHGHWTTTTFVAGLTLRGMIAPARHCPRTNGGQRLAAERAD